MTGNLQPLDATLSIVAPVYNEAAILDEFVAELRASLIDLKQLAGEKCFADVARKAHWLKGSAGSAGFGVLTLPTAELERAAKAGQSQGVDEWLGRIEKIVARIQSSAASETATM